MVWDGCWRWERVLAQAGTPNLLRICDVLRLGWLLRGGGVEEYDKGGYETSVA